MNKEKNKEASESITIMNEIKTVNCFAIRNHGTINF